jgi:hypothetical protein
LDDDYSTYYKDNKEYEQAFSTKSDLPDSGKKWFQFWKKGKPQTVDLESFTGKFGSTEQASLVAEEKDEFQSFLEDKGRIIFAEYHVQDSKFETVFAVRSNASVGTSVAWLENPTRLVISFKEPVISALPAFEAVNKGAIVSLKTLQKKVPLPSEYQGWSKILSLIIELDAKHEYEMISESDVFKVTIKK